MIRNKLVILFVVFSSMAFSQRIGFQAGGVLTGLQQSTSTKTGNFNILTGAVGGPEIEFKVNEKYAINTAALFEFRAGRYDISWYKPSTTYTRILYYIQLPVHLTYRVPTTKKAQWMFFTGPKLNTGFFGSTNEHYYLSTTSQIDEENPFGGIRSMKRMDILYDIGVGLELQRFQFKLGYSFPITNSVNVSDLNTLYQHQLQLTVGFTLKKFDKLVKKTAIVED